MKHPTGQKRSRWFWAGVILLSITALGWLIFLIPVIIADPQFAVMIVAIGIVLSAVPILIGAYCIMRGSKSRAMAMEKGGETVTPEMTQTAMDGMRDIESQQVIALHKVGFRKELEITDKGIRTKKLNIPYSLIKECNCYRDPAGVPDKCGVKYIDQSGLDKHVEFGGRGLEIYSDILRIAKQHGHKISQQPHGQLLEWARRLKALNVESEFVEPEVEYNRQGDSYWQRDLGGLGLRGAAIDAVKVEEGGKITVENADQYSSRKVDIQYRFTYLIQIEPIPDVSSYGKPMKKFPRRVVDYQWWGGKLAQKPQQDMTLPEGMTLRDIMKEARARTTGRIADSTGAGDDGLKKEVVGSGRRGDKFGQSLNGDAQLRKMLTKAKAPVIGIKGNQIHIQDKKFPSLKLFQCIDMLAGYVRKEGNS